MRCNVIRQYNSTQQRGTSVCDFGHLCSCPLRSLSLSLTRHCIALHCVALHPHMLWIEYRSVSGVRCTCSENLSVFLALIIQNLSNCSVLLYHITPCHVLSYHIISYHTMSDHINSASASASTLSLMACSFIAMTSSSSRVLIGRHM